MCNPTIAVDVRITMFLQIMRFITLMLAALGMTMGAAHVLELVPKMQYNAQMYKEVNSTLYLFYGIVGGVIQVSSIIAAVVLAFLVRGRPAFRLTIFGTLCLVLSLGLWFILVQPVNTEWGEVLRAAPEATVLESYMRLRDRWEYGHVTAFTAWVGGVSLLVLSVIIETPVDHPHNRAA
jgi:hypothetical protein